MPEALINEHLLFYREQGSGPLLIVLPGNTASSVWHDRELAEFGRQSHTIVLDLLGTGRSARLANWPKDWWQQGARDAVALIEQQGEKQAVLVGTSGGAAAALWAAILNPERVLAVIADSLTETIAPQALRAEINARAQKTPSQVAFWSRAHGPDWEKVVEADSWICLALAAQGGNWFGGRLQEISCPVLISGSLTDELLPDAGPQLMQMSAQIPESELFLINGGNHPLMWSRADAFHTAAAGFLKRVLKPKPDQIEEC